MTHALRIVDDREERPTVRRRPFWVERMIERARVLVGMICTRIGVPGFVRNFAFDDKMTGNKIEFIVTARATTLRVNGRDYSFGRFSGGFRGTGTVITQHDGYRSVEAPASPQSRASTDQRSPQ